MFKNQFMLDLHHIFPRPMLYHCPGIESRLMMYLQTYFLEMFYITQILKVNLDAEITMILKC